MNGPTGEEISNILARLKARELQREQQQGRGRPIVSGEWDGKRLVAVGNTLLASDKWVTFHDFLLSYVIEATGREWGRAELKRPEADRHPVVRWHTKVKAFFEANRDAKSQQVEGGRRIRTAPMTGAVRAFLELGYYLYLLKHNVKLQERLLTRLRISSQFNAAFYETFVIATFVKAGFHVELEDESDVSTTHSEFTATSSMGRKFSVEAKWRTPGKASASVANQLHSALKKSAKHERVVFIEMSAAVAAQERVEAKLSEAIASVRAAEERLKVGQQPAPRAYVVLTNQAHVLQLEVEALPIMFAVEGFKIADFKHDFGFHSIREAVESRDRHKEVLLLASAIRDFHEIPTTFDGEVPELAFGEHASRLQVGKTYRFPTREGVFLDGVLQQGIVIEKEKKAACVMNVGGSHVLTWFSLSDEEVAAYKRHPDTFFGTYQRQTRRANDALDLYDFFVESYAKASKEQLLKNMAGHPNLKTLRLLAQSELLKKYAEMLTESVVRRESMKAAPGN